MLNNKCEEQFRTLGMLAADIICLIDCYAEPEETFRKSIYYTDLLSQKDCVVSEIREGAKKIKETIRQMDVKLLSQLYEQFSISLVEYSDMLCKAIENEKNNYTEAQNCAKAILRIAIDRIYFDLQNDTRYKEIAQYG